MSVFGGNMGRPSMVERRPYSIRRDTAVPVRSGGTAGAGAHRHRYPLIESADRATPDAC